MVDAELGLTLVFNGCIYNYQQLRDELEAPGLPVLLHLRHRGDPQGLPPLGQPLRRPLPRHVRVRDRRAGQRPAGARPRPAGHQAALPGARPARLRFASTLPALLAAGDVDTSIDPVALHHYMCSTRSCRRRAPSCPASASCRRPPCGSSSPTAAPSDLTYWAPEFVRGAAEQSERRSGRDRPGGAADGGRAPDGRRRAGRGAALRRPRLQPDRRAAGRGRAARASRPSASASSPRAARAGDEFEFSDLVAKEFDTDHHQIRMRRPGPTRPGRGRSRR